MARRGPTAQSGTREPNGRLTRRQEKAAERAIDRSDLAERQTLSVGIAARNRVHGVGLRNAQDQRAGSFIGRLCMLHMVTKEQYDAALIWLSDAEDYRKAIGPVAGRQPGAVDLNALKGRSGYENVPKVIMAMERYREACNAVQAVQNEMRGSVALFAALNHIVERDLELHHMVGDCRIALNALAKHYKNRVPVVEPAVA